MNTPIIVALFFGLAGTFYLGIYFIYRIRRRNAILEQHLRAEVFRVPDAPDAKPKAPKPYRNKLAPIDPKQLPPKVKRRSGKGRAPKPYKPRQMQADPKALPPPKATAQNHSLN